MAYSQSTHNTPLPCQEVITSPKLLGSVSSSIWSDTNLIELAVKPNTSLVNYITLFVFCTDSIFM